MSDWRDEERASEDVKRNILLGVVAVAAIMAWMFISRPEDEVPSSQGFNLDAPSAAPSVAGRRYMPTRQTTGLDFAGGMIAEEPAFAKFVPPSATTREQAHAGLTREFNAHEEEIKAFSRRMAKKHPILGRYVSDWKSYPDLKKLDDDYNRDKNPVKFLLGVAASKNFGKMVGKYAASPEMHQYVMEGIKEAPEGLKQAAMDVLKNDQIIKGLVSSVLQNAGVPAALTGIVNGGAVDQNKVMSEMLSDPKLQNMIQQR